MKHNKLYIISPSELSYICAHCAHIKKNYDISNQGISAGVTQTLDGIEKEFFLGNTKRISDELPDGKVIDPYNEIFYSKVLEDNKGRPFRIKGKCDALIKFRDGTDGVLDYKTSKFKKKHSEDTFKQDDLQKKINQYDPQLHCYDLLYSNLETDEDFLKEHHRIKYKAKDPVKINAAYHRKIKKIKEIKINNTTRLGLVFIYPENLSSKKSISVNFSFEYCEVPVDKKRFLKELTKYMDILHQDVPPPPPEKDCKPKVCSMHKFFYRPKLLKAS